MCRFRFDRFDFYKRVTALAGSVAGSGTTKSDCLGPIPIALVTGGPTPALPRRSSCAKPNTLLNYQADHRSVAKAFGDKPLDATTSDDADAFRSHLKAKGLGEATDRRRCKRVRQFFKAAIKSKLIAENPFADIACSDFANSDRQRFVNREETQAVLDAAPDAQWRMIVALCRYGGVRCPSEVLGLTWADIDWEQRRFRVHATKTEHHADGGNRIVPLFPELYLMLTEDLFQRATKGSANVTKKAAQKAAHYSAQQPAAGVCRDSHEKK